MPLISDSIGRVLGKRYRLLSALGTGASAHVFLAEDVSLQRHVAVKVLQPGLATDEAFLKRFGPRPARWPPSTIPTCCGSSTGVRTPMARTSSGVSRRGLAARPARPGRPAEPLPGRPAGDRGGAGPGLCARPGPGAPRHQAGQPALRRGGPGAGGRLRRGPRPGRSGLHRAGGGDGGHGPLHASPESAEGKPVDGRADVYSLALVLYEALSGHRALRDGHDHGHADGPGRGPLPPHEALGPLDDVLARAAAPRCLRPGWTRPASRPGWARWPVPCPRPSRFPSTRPSMSPAGCP
jgi:hypothetical protein